MTIYAAIYFDADKIELDYDIDKTQLNLLKKINNKIDNNAIDHCIIFKSVTDFQSDDYKYVIMPFIENALLGEVIDWIYSKSFYPCTPSHM